MTSRSASGERVWPGAHSSTTAYWFSSLYMVATWRWPKASYSAASMLDSDTPRLAARSRSTCTKASTLLSLWSSSTSVRRASRFICSDSRRVQAFRSAWLSALSVYW